MLKFFKMKILKKSMISLNNNIKNKIYLNVKKLKNLILLFNDRIDEIFTIIKFIIAKFIFFKNCFKQKYAIKRKYAKITKFARETTKKIIKTIRQIIRKKNEFLHNLINESTIRTFKNIQLKTIRKQMYNSIDFVKRSNEIIDVHMKKQRFSYLICK